MRARRLIEMNHLITVSHYWLLVICVGMLPLTYHLSAAELNWSKKGKGVIALIGEERAQLWSRSTGVLGSLARHNKSWLRERKLETEDYQAKTPEQVHDILTKEKISS